MFGVCESRIRAGLRPQGQTCSQVRIVVDPNVQKTDLFHCDHACALVHAQISAECVDAAGYVQSDNGNSGQRAARLTSVCDLALIQSQYDIEEQVATRPRRPEASHSSSRARLSSLIE